MAFHRWIDVVELWRAQSLLAHSLKYRSLMLPMLQLRQVAKILLWGALETPIASIGASIASLKVVQTKSRTSRTWVIIATRRFSRGVLPLLTSKALWLPSIKWCSSRLKIHRQHSWDLAQLMQLSAWIQDSPEMVKSIKQRAQWRKISLRRSLTRASI